MMFSNVAQLCRPRIAPGWTIFTVYQPGKASQKAFAVGTKQKRPGAMPGLLHSFRPDQTE